MSIDPLPETLKELSDALSLPESRLLPWFHSQLDLTSGDTDKDLRSSLLSACRHLFLDIERLGRIHQSVLGDRQGELGSDDVGLSGLHGLYFGPAVDVETVWGQVELQNAAIEKAFESSLKQLSRSPDRICLLKMNEVLSDANASDHDVECRDLDNSARIDSLDDDEQTRRIRDRMELAKQDLESEEECSVHDYANDSVVKSQQPSNPSRGDSTLVDAAAEELNDGFFDIHEMEDFADEEEAFLPDDAFGMRDRTSTTFVGQQKSFHQRQRDQDFGAVNSEDDDDNDDPKEVQTVRERKYRDSEDIEALFSLYDEPASSGSDAEVVNLSAAEIFGEPNKKYFNKYRKDAETRSRTQPTEDWSREDDNMNRDRRVELWEQHGVETNGTSHERSDLQNSSIHAKQSEQLRQQTEELESELLAEKPWQLSGESKSVARPVNSLLLEGTTPEFQFASRIAPTISVEQSTNLEEVIKQRVRGEDWDDVIPRELPDVSWHRDRGELPDVSQEKSKLGLGEIYEREYLRKAAGYDRDAVEKYTEEEAAKDELKRLFASLCSKLDALSNYHFAPRPVADEAEVRLVTTPAIAMEEVLPLHVSDARGVAPQEVYAPKRGRDGVLRNSETEVAQIDRKRKRASKKAARRKARKQKLADERLISRLEPGLGLNNPYERRQMREELSMAVSQGKVKAGEQVADTAKLGKSGTFFKRLQAEVQKSKQTTLQVEALNDGVKNPSRSSAYRL